MQNLQKEQQVFVEEGRRKQVYQWLAAPDPSINHAAAARKKQAGSGSWLVDSEILTSWKVDPGSSLWIFGIRKYRYKF
jgi:outer membrane protein TolC